MRYSDQAWREWAKSHVHLLSHDEALEFIEIIDHGSQADQGNAMHRFFADIELTTAPWNQWVVDMAEAQRRGDPEVCAPNQPPNGITFPGLMARCGAA